MAYVVFLLWLPLFVGVAAYCLALVYNEETYEYQTHSENRRERARLRV